MAVEKKETKERYLYVHKTRIRVNNKQDSFFRGCAGFRRVAYNWALNATAEAWEKEIRLSPFQADKAFNAIKKELYPWSYEYPSCVGQQAIVSDLKSGFEGFFRRVKAGDKAGYPKFKSKFKCSDSFKLTNVALKASDISGSRIKLPKNQGAAKLSSKPRYEGRLLSTTISRRGEKWYASLLYELESAPILEVASCAPIGLDAGVKRLATISDGSYFNHPKELDRLREKKKHLQRKLSKLQGPDKRKSQKASKAWRDLSGKVKLVDIKITNVRANSHHQITARLSKKYQVVVIEDLNLKGMTKSAKGSSEKHGKNVKAKSGLNREMLNAGIGELRRQLQYKTARHKGLLVAVDPKYTSQMCSDCGHTSRDNRKTQSVFECVECGHSMNADENAAINILNRGMNELAGNSVGGAGSESLNDGGGAMQLGRPLKPLASAA